MVQKICGFQAKNFAKKFALAKKSTTVICQCCRDNMEFHIFVTNKNKPYFHNSIFFFYFDFTYNKSTKIQIVFLNDYFAKVRTRRTSCSCTRVRRAVWK